MNSITQPVRDVYQTKAAITRKRRDAADKRLAASEAERRRLFQLKLDAIVAAKSQAKDGAA